MVLSPAHGRYLLRIRGVKLHAEWPVCTFLARSRNCIMLSVAWHWIENQICMGTKKIYIDLGWVSISITKCIYLRSRGQPMWSEKPVSVLLILVDKNHSFFEIGIYPHCVQYAQLPYGVFWVCYDLHNTRTLFPFSPTLTPLWLTSLTVMTHLSHTYSTLTHISHAHSTMTQSPLSALSLYIQLDTHL